MSRPTANPLAPILPAPPAGDRSPTASRSNDAGRGGLFAGWGPKL
jgi:hypothetical protein